MATYTYNILSKDGRKLSDKQLYILCQCRGMHKEEISDYNYDRLSQIIAGELEQYKEDLECGEKFHELKESDFDWEDDIIFGEFDGCKWKPF